MAIKIISIFKVPTISTMPNALPTSSVKNSGAAEFCLSGAQTQKVGIKKNNGLAAGENSEQAENSVGSG